MIYSILFGVLLSVCSTAAYIDFANERGSDADSTPCLGCDENASGPAGPTKDNKNNNNNNNKLIDQMRQRIDGLEKKSTQKDSVIEALRKSVVDLGSRLGKDVAALKKQSSGSNVNDVKKSLSELKQLTLKLSADVKMVDQRVQKGKQVLDHLTKDVQNLQPKCPDQSWQFFETKGTCYKLFTKSKTWKGASDKCRSLDAKLVVIPDAETNGFVTDLITSSAWTGLNDVNKGHGNISAGVREFVWNDDVKSAAYVNWARGMPNSNTVKHDNDYGFITPGGVWYNADSSATNWYICERNADERAMVLT